jgi:hypothetical protein
MTIAILPLLRAAESPNVTVIASIAGLANQRYVPVSAHSSANCFSSSFSSFHSFFIRPSILDRSRSSRSLQNESPKRCSCLLSSKPANRSSRISIFSHSPQTCPPSSTHFRVDFEQRPTNPPTASLHFPVSPKIDRVQTKALVAQDLRVATTTGISRLRSLSVQVLAIMLECHPPR